jgi:hypothetical protein
LKQVYRRKKIDKRAALDKHYQESLALIGE